MDHVEMQVPISEVIMDEVARFKNDEDEEMGEEEKLIGYLNNFPSKIPLRSGFAPTEAMFVPFARTQAEKEQAIRDIRQLKFVEFGEGGSKEEKVENFRRAGHSDKYIFGTGEQFLQDIESAIVSSGVEREALLTYLESQANFGVGSAADYEKVKNLVLPIFMKMREMGYSYADLNL